MTLFQTGIYLPFTMPATIVANNATPGRQLIIFEAVPRFGVS
jgi:hypothetical protein